MQLSSLNRSQTSYDFLLTSTDVLHHWAPGELLLSFLSLSNISFPQNIIFPRVQPWITLLCSFNFMYVQDFGWCGQTCVNGKLSPSLRLQNIIIQFITGQAQVDYINMSLTTTKEYPWKEVAEKEWYTSQLK